MSIIVVEGIDRLGKGSIIKGIIEEYGYRHVIHYSKPVKSKVYRSLQEYQYDSFRRGFECLKTLDIHYIFDRFHLGEVVYSPRYRGYDGKYVYNLEDLNLTLLRRMWLILLYTDNFEFLVDDGNSFDFDKKQEEMDDFVNAFHKSKVPHKIMINVHNGHGDYKRFDEILTEALTFLKETPYATLLSSSIT